LVGFLTATLSVIVLGAEPTNDGVRPLVDRFEVTSGSWRSAADGTGALTDSTTFRARSRDSRLASPEMTVEFRIDDFGDFQSSHDWDGVHVGLRYASPDDLYYVSLARRDGTVAIKRKANGAYETLATAEHHVDLGRWHEGEVWVRDEGDGVRVRLVLDGEVVLEALDDEPLPPGGSVSLRSDNASVAFGDVEVRDTD
jgi:hypothetical protein